MKLKWKENDITKYVTSVTWSGSARQAARTVAFSVAYSPNDKSVETLDIKLGDKIVFYPDSNQKVHFVGAVTERIRCRGAAVYGKGSYDPSAKIQRDIPVPEQNAGKDYGNGM